MTAKSSNFTTRIAPSCMKVLLYACLFTSTVESKYTLKDGDIYYRIKPGYRPYHIKIEYILSGDRIIATHYDDSLISFSDTGKIGSTIRSNWSRLKNIKYKVDSTYTQFDGSSTAFETTVDTISFGSNRIYDTSDLKIINRIGILLDDIDRNFRQGSGQRILDSLRLTGIALTAQRIQCKIDSISSFGGVIHEVMQQQNQKYRDKFHSASNQAIANYGTTFGIRIDCQHSSKQ